MIPANLKLPPYEEFISFEEFVALPDLPEVNRHLVKSLMGPAWLEWYHIAKASFILFGNDGPPLNSDVITLTNGFNGTGCNIRILGDYKEDNRFFSLSRYVNDPHVSISYKATWWRDFAPYSGSIEEQKCFAKRINNMLKGNY
jgi:hypothetical protein